MPVSLQANVRTRLFEDLPAELRVHIYEFHLQDLKADRIIPTQPPITKVSRLLREESLPLFYKICKFQASFVYGSLPCNATQKFFSRAPVEVLEKIRELHVRGNTVFEPHSAYRWAYIEFTLRNAGDDLNFEDPKVPESDPLVERDLEVIRERVRNSGIQDRDDKLRLQRSDVNALAKVFERVEN